MYALKYQCVFDRVGPVSETPVYKIEILQKGYSGQVYNCIGGAVPVLHQWETDDPKAPLKGSSLTITLVNKDGNLPLSSFFSTDDDDFLVKLSFSKSQTISDTATVSVVPAGMGQTHVTINKPFDVTNATYFILDGVRYDIISASSDGTNTYLTTFATPVIIGVVKDFSIVYSDKRVLFTGFLVQDDCSEQLVDFTHEINLSANDNLGLLKDVSLDKANIFSISYTSGTIGFGGDFPTRTFLFFDVDLSGELLPGDRVEIISGSLTGIYTVIKVVNAAPNTLVYVEEPLPTTAVYYTTFNIYTPANLLDKTPLSTILRMCLSVTGLTLNTNIYGKIIETSQDATRSFLEQTLIDPQTFLKSDTEYTDCYDVLTKILDRFNMTLFQANGVWNIVRWDELKYYNNLIEGFTYDSDFIYVGEVAMAAPLIAGVDEGIQAETGLIQKIVRPFLYDQETFNYQFPRQLLRNFNLQQLGSEIRSYTTGSGTNLKRIVEYNLPWWSASTMPMSVTGPAFIRITYDDLDNEIERVLVVYGDIKSYPIEVNAGDTFKFSFSFKTEDSQPGNVVLQAFIEVNDGISPVFFRNPATTVGTNMWQTVAGFSINVQSGDNTNQWHNVEVDTSRFPIPHDGLLYLYLRVADLSGTKHETYYKDIRFEYTARINQSTKIIGQTHEASQSGVIKNNEEVEIFIDSSPRNSISGTLFLNGKTGVLQKRTEFWRHPYKLTQKIKLGDLMTFEQLFWRRLPRTILEGSLYAVISGSGYISLLSVFKYSLFPQLNFVFGRMEIDYKNNKVDGTMWEMWQDEETDDNLPRHYQFNYLYSTT